MKKIKILTIILLIIAISMIGFGGIYIQKQNRMENQVKDYDLAMEMEGSRHVKYVLNTETTTTIKDAEGKEVEDTGELTDDQLAEKGYVKEEVPNNSDEAKTIENYKKSKKIIEKRLERIGVENYIIKLDETNGDIIIELPENNGTDSVVSNVNNTGKFEILDSETKEVLINNDDIKTARVMYGSSNSSTSSGTQIYLDIEFTSEGAKKLEEISKTYVKNEETDTSSEDETQDTENTTEDGTQDIDNTTQEKSTEETDEQTQSSEETEETKEKQITMKIDGEEIMTTSFEETISTGKLQLSVGSATTDAKTLQNNLTSATNMAVILDTGATPLKYDLDDNEYILSDITENQIQIIKYVIIAIAALAIIILVIKHKGLGILGAISYIGYLATLLLIVRYTNVVLSLEGIFGIGIILILNYILVNKLLTSPKLGETYKEFFVKIIPVIILVITFCFIKWEPISSFGMVMFWGIALIAVYNSIITNSILKIRAGKEK